MGYFPFSYIINGKQTFIYMRREEIVDEIRQMCGQALFMPSLGWHFRDNGQVYFYVVGKDESMIRFCIPFVTGISSQDKELLKDAVNETNKNVKFTKALLSENDGLKISLDIVPHIIKVLDFAAEYLLKKINGF